MAELLLDFKEVIENEIIEVKAWRVPKSKEYPEGVNYRIDLPRKNWTRKSVSLSKFFRQISLFCLSWAGQIPAKGNLDNKSVESADDLPLVISLRLKFNVGKLAKHCVQFFRGRSWRIASKSS